MQTAEAEVSFLSQQSRDAHLRTCHAPGSVRTVIPTPTGEEHESQRRVSFLSGLEAAKMVITEARLRGDRRQILGLAKALCGHVLSHLAQGLFRWVRVGSIAKIPDPLVTLAPVPVML